MNAAVFAPDSSSLYSHVPPLVQRLTAGGTITDAEIKRIVSVVDYPDPMSGRTLLFTACMMQDVELALKLLDAGADPHVVCPGVGVGTMMAIVPAVTNNLDAVVRRMVSRGDVVRLLENLASHPLDTQGKSPFTAALIEFFEGGGSPEASDEEVMAWTRGVSTSDPVSLEEGAEYGTAHLEDLVMSVSKMALPQQIKLTVLQLITERLGDTSQSRGLQDANLSTMELMVISTLRAHVESPNYADLHESLLAISEMSESAADVKVGRSHDPSGSFHVPVAVTEADPEATDPKDAPVGMASIHSISDLKKTDEHVYEANALMMPVPYTSVEPDLNTVYDEIMHVLGNIRFRFSDLERFFITQGNRGSTGPSLRPVAVVGPLGGVYSRFRNGEAAVQSIVHITGTPEFNLLSAEEMRWQCVQPAAEVNRTDAHPPLVKGVVPDRGARDVPLRLVVRVTLTRPFSDEEAAAFERDPGVFAAFAVHPIYEPEGMLETSVTYDADSPALSFTADGVLAPATVYHCHFQLDGKTETTLSWTFRTSDLGGFVGGLAVEPVEVADRMERTQVLQHISAVSDMMSAEELRLHQTINVVSATVESLADTDVLYGRLCDVDPRTDVRDYCKLGEVTLFFSTAVDDALVELVEAHVTVRPMYGAAPLSFTTRVNPRHNGVVLVLDTPMHPGVSYAIVAFGVRTISWFRTSGSANDGIVMDMIEILPPEISCHILSQLSGSDVVSCLHVCRAWNRFCSDPVVWAPYLTPLKPSPFGRDRVAPPITWDPEFITPLIRLIYHEGVSYTITNPEYSSYCVATHPILSCAVDNEPCGAFHYCEVTIVFIDNKARAQVGLRPRSLNVTGGETFVAHHAFPALQRGDVIGCGYDCIRNLVYFTINGHAPYYMVAPAKRARLLPLYPCIMMHGRSILAANFGERPFVFRDCEEIHRGLGVVPSPFHFACPDVRQRWMGGSDEPIEIPFDKASSMVQRSIYNIGFQNRCYVEFVLSPVGIGTCAAIGLAEADFAGTHWPWPHAMPAVPVNQVLRGRNNSVLKFGVTMQGEPIRDASYAEMEANLAPLGSEAKERLGRIVIGAGIRGSRAFFTFCGTLVYDTLLDEGAAPLFPAVYVRTAQGESNTITPRFFSSFTFDVDYYLATGESRSLAVDLDEAGLLGNATSAGEAAGIKVASEYELTRRRRVKIRRGKLRKGPPLPGYEPGNQHAPGPDDVPLPGFEPAEGHGQG